MQLFLNRCVCFDTSSDPTSNRQSSFPIAFAPFYRVSRLERLLNMHFCVPSQGYGTLIICKPLPEGECNTLRCSKDAPDPHANSALHCYSNLQAVLRMNFTGNVFGDKTTPALYPFSMLKSGAGPSNAKSKEDASFETVMIKVFSAKMSPGQDRRPIPKGYKPG